MTLSKISKTKNTTEIPENKKINNKIISHVRRPQMKKVQKTCYS